MSTPRSRSQKRYLMRLAVRTRAASMQLSEIETLATFQREDGLIVTVDANGVWHNLDTSDADLGTILLTQRAAPLPEGVTPETVKTIDRVKALRNLDINGNSFNDIRKHIVYTAKVALAALEMHDAIGPGPEWREELERLAKEA